MGYNTSRLEIRLQSSAHNSWRDDRDRMLIKDLVDRLAAIVSEPQYEDITDPISYGEAEHPSYMPSPVWTVPLTRDQLYDLEDLQRRR